MKIIAMLSMFLMILGNTVFSQSEESPDVKDCYEDGDVTVCESEDDYEDDEEFFCGLETKFKDGELWSIKVCGEGDWRGKYRRSKVSDAREEAELNAKAKLAHFFGEQITSEKFTKTLSSATIKECLDSDDEETECSKKEDEEEARSGGTEIEDIKIQMKQISAKADQYLQGVQRIANGPVDKEEKFTLVLIGWSLKSNKAATNARSKMLEGKKGKKKKKKKSGWGKKSGMSGSKSKNFDDF